MFQTDKPADHKLVPKLETADKQAPANHRLVPEKTDKLAPADHKIVRGIERREGFLAFIVAFISVALILTVMAIIYLYRFTQKTRSMKRLLKQEEENESNEII